jgi:Amt family ammonium transporter
LTGGCTALYGAAILGPRKGRFEGTAEEKAEYLPQSTLMIVLGTFILWFGWFGFNGGSTTALSGGSAEVAAHCCATTTVAAALGGVFSFLIGSKLAGKYDIAAFANGILGGLVGITAGCSNVDMGAALFIGLVSGIILPFTCKLLEKIKIDDPISAFPVHGMCGIWGCLATGLFDMDTGIIGGDGTCFGPNLLGVLCIMGWCAATSIPLFIALRVTGLLRAKAEQEDQGLDIKFVRSPTQAGRPSAPAAAEAAPAESA